MDGQDALFQTGTTLPTDADADPSNTVNTHWLFHSESNKLLHLQSGHHWESMWSQRLIHCLNTVQTLSPSFYWYQGQMFQWSQTSIFGLVSEGQIILIITSNYYKLKRYRKGHLDGDVLERLHRNISWWNSFHLDDLVPVVLLDLSK